MDITELLYVRATALKLAPNKWGKDFSFLIDVIWKVSTCTISENGSIEVQLETSEWYHLMNDTTWRAFEEERERSRLEST